MDELKLLVDLHKNNNRQGPGSSEETLKALSFVNLPNNEEVVIADIGCGSGSQTFVLAENTNSQILAVDIFPELLEELNKRAGKKGLNKRIQTIEATMEDLPFAKDSLDLIWSEGAIYNMGFKKGLEAWHKYLKPGGYIAVSEVTWISNNPSVEIKRFWKTEYPEIGSAAQKITDIESAGYTLCGYFYLKEHSWIQNYYKPLEEGYRSFLERHAESAEAMELIKVHQHEFDLYMKFKDQYSYGFYIAKKAL